MNSEKLLDSEITDAIKDILDKEGFAINQYFTDFNRSKGDGFVADIIRIEVEKKRKHQGTIIENTSFVIKKEPSESKRINATAIRTLFQREIFIYEIFLPTMLELLQSKESILGKDIVNSFVITPKYYRTIKINEYSAIILDDMKPKGYQIAPKRIQMNQQWCETVLNHLARFHACSFALKDQRSKDFCRFKEIMVDEMIMEEPLISLDKLINSKCLENINLMSECFEPHSIYMEKIKLLGENENTYQKLYLKIKEFRNNSDYGVFCHGDFWANNLIFRFTKDFLEEVCFLDFQITRWGCSVIDLSTFLFTCADFETMTKFHELIEFYYQNLSQSIQILGSNPELLYPREVFDEQFKQYSIYGFLIATTFIYPIVKEIVNIRDVCSGINDIKSDDSVNPETQELVNKDYIKKHVKTLLCFMVDNNCL